MKTLHTLVLGVVLALGGGARAITVDEVIDRMVGDYRETATNLHVTRVSLDHTEDAVYVELVVTGAETQARQMIITFFQDGENVAARAHVYAEQVGNEFVQDLRFLTLGLWAAPDLFPPLLRSQLDAVADTHVEETSEGLRIAFDDAPVALYGAYTMDCDIHFVGERAEWRRTGHSPAGEELWTEEVVFDRIDIEPPVTRFENGVVYIDIRKGSGVALAEGDQIAFNYIGVLNDGRRFDSTHFDGRGMFAGSFPSGIHPQMARGMIGVQCPTAISDENRHLQPIRKIVLPPSVAFGDEKVGPIPPNSTLYYLALVESIRDRTPDEPETDD